jgi:hypothetical protein
MNYVFGYSILFLEIIGFVAEFRGKVARSVYVGRRATNEKLLSKVFANC